MANKNSDHGGSTAPVSKPTVEAPVAPPVRRQMIERRGGTIAPVSRRKPQVRGGVCEHCGTIDPLLPPEEQYKLCNHYREIGELRCSYCPEEKNPVDVISHAVLNVAEHPNDPSRLIVWCDSFECSKKHLQRFGAKA